MHLRKWHLWSPSNTRPVGEDILVCAGQDGGDRPLQLRELAARLRKADEPQALLKALTAAQPLIEAAPVELPHCASMCLPGTGCLTSEPLAGALAAVSPIASARGAAPERRSVGSLGRLLRSPCVLDGDRMRGRPPYRRRL